MASFQFTAHCVGENATNVVIDDVNTMAAAKQIAQVQYPGWDIRNGHKISSAHDKSFVNSSYTGGRYKETYTPGGVGPSRAQLENNREGDAARARNEEYDSELASTLGGLLIGGTFWLGTELIRMTWNFATDVLRVALRWSLITLRNLTYAVQEIVRVVGDVTRNVCSILEDALNQNWHIYR